MHRRQDYSTTAKPLGQICTDGTTLRTGSSDVHPFLNRTARRRDTQLRALGHTRMIYTTVGIVGIVCTIMAPSSWKLLDPCVTNGSPVRLCASACVCVCVPDPRWVYALILADAPSRILPCHGCHSFYSSLPHPPCQPAYLLDLLYLFSTFACPFLSIFLFPSHSFTKTSPFLY